MSERELVGGPNLYMQEAFKQTAKRYEGTVIFAPSMRELAIAMGLQSQYDISAYNRGIRYPHILKALSGLDVVHRGFVLGDPSLVGGEITVPELESIEATEVRAAFDRLPDDDKARLARDINS